MATQQPSAPFEAEKLRAALPSALGPRPGQGIKKPSGKKLVLVSGPEKVSNVLSRNLGSLTYAPQNLAAAAPLALRPAPLRRRPQLGSGSTTTNTANMAPLAGPAATKPPAAATAAEAAAEEGVEKGGEVVGEAWLEAALTAYLSDPEKAEKFGGVWTEHLGWVRFGPMGPVGGPRSPGEYPLPPLAPRPWFW